MDLSKKLAGMPLVREATKGNWLCVDYLKVSVFLSPKVVWFYSKYFSLVSELNALVNMSQLWVSDEI